MNIHNQILDFSKSVVMNEHSYLIDYGDAQFNQGNPLYEWESQCEFRKWIK